MTTTLFSKSNELPTHIFSQFMRVLAQPYRFFTEFHQNPITARTFMLGSLLILVVALRGSQQAPPEPDAAWTQALLALLPLVAAWVGGALFLALLRLLEGDSPQIQHNLQAAIWVSVPFALMAILQIAYQVAGGVAGAPGVSGVVTEWALYREAPAALQGWLRTFAAMFTLFWCWWLLLLGIAAHASLHTRRWLVVPMLLLFVLVMVSVATLVHMQGIMP